MLSAVAEADNPDNDATVVLMPLIDLDIPCLCNLAMAFSGFPPLQSDHAQNAVGGSRLSSWIQEQ